MGFMTHYLQPYGMGTITPRYLLVSPCLKNDGTLVSKSHIFCIHPKFWGKIPFLNGDLGLLSKAYVTYRLQKIQFNVHCASKGKHGQSLLF